MPSPSYVLTRLLQIIPTFLFIMVVVFVLVRLLPGDPASAILGERATDEAVERINHQLGLDQPIPVQFAIFLERFLQGDLGNSIHLKVPVVQLVAERLPVTGIVVCKLDGTARGGVVVAVRRELGVPVKLVGLGEGPDDLVPFDPALFAEGLLR